MKRFLALILAAMMVLSMAACGNVSDETKGNDSNVSADGEIAKPSAPERLSLGSGSSGGNFYLVGGGIATVLNNALPDYFVITSEETGGGTANLTMLQNGDVELGIAMTSSLYEAWNGSADWTGGEMKNLRGMLALYPSFLTIYTLSDSGIKTLDDINDHIIGLGSKGAAMDSIFREALPAMGVNPSDIFNDGHGATATALSDGNIDVALLFSYPPFSAITELEATKELTFIGLTEDQQKYLTDTYPFYSAADMPAGSYAGVTEDLPVVSEWNMLVTSTNVSEDYAYLMMKTLCESNPELLEIHKSLIYATAENNANFNIPLHAGVVRYMEEMNIEVPEELIPPEYSK